MKVDPWDLGVALGDEASLVAADFSMFIALELVDPLTSDGLSAFREGTNLQVPF